MMNELKDGDVVHGITISKEALQKKKLYISTPMSRGECKGIYAASLANLFFFLGKWQIPFQYSYITGDSCITRARNRIAVEFLNSECTDMLMLDNDIGFHAGDILVMLSAGKEFISAAYPLKHINWEKIRYAAETHTADELMRIACSDFVLNYGKDFDVNAVSKVPEVGAGCTLLSRSVFKKLIPDVIRSIPKQDEPSYKGYTYEFFTSGNEPEDYLFCRKWKFAGGEIYLCPWIILSHMGEIEFKGSMKYAFLEGSKYNRENREKVLV
jgi:hypothetical protein